MKEQKTKILETIPGPLLKKIDLLAKKAKKDRSAFMCATLESKFLADECRDAYAAT